MKLLKRIFQWKRMYLLILIPVGLLLVLIAKFNAPLVDVVYSHGIQLFLKNTWARFISLFPFSVSEWVILLAVLGVLTYIGFVIVWIIRRPSSWKHTVYRAFVNALCVGSVGFFAFLMTMGLAYYRTPAAEHFELKVRPYSVDELKEVTIWLGKNAALQRAKLNENSQGVAVLEEQKFSVNAAEAQNCFNRVGERYEEIGTVYARSKPMIASEMMSRVMTLGVYMPILMESNINVDVMEYTMPMTMCHELSHAAGFMREEEANFIGFLACIQSERADFKYSGYMQAFLYALGQLSEVDRDAAVEVAALVSDGMLRDDQADNEYWEQYRKTVIAETSGQVYEEYLQANGQQSGLQSYGEMVDLVIAWYQAEVKNID